MTIAYSGDSITYPDNSVQNTAPKIGMVNRIINGAMVIDQRNAGASVTPTNTGGSTYLLDRWKADISQASKFSVQQSSTAPAGFTNSMAVTSLSAYSVGSAEVFAITQIIEGYNVADLGWGAAGASAVTLSFWVRSSLTGTFGIVLENSANNRSYPATYTISAANTWEQKFITIAGDTSGTWVKNNGKGIQIKYGLGVGSTLSGTSGAWAAADYWGATGATSVVGTSGATFYITGIDLRKGSTGAYSNGQNDFDYRPYGTELALCQRYYQYWGGTATYERIAAGYAVSTTSAEVFVPRFSVVMRSAPSLSANSVSNFRVSEASNSFIATAIGISQAAPNSCGISVTVASGLTANRPMSMDTNNTTSAHLGLSAEL